MGAFNTGFDTVDLRDLTKSGVITHPFVPWAVMVPRPLKHRKVSALGGSMTQPRNRGLQSSTFRLNVSAFCGIGGAFRGRLEGVYEVLVGVRGCLEWVSGCILYQKRLRLS